MTKKNVKQPSHLGQLIRQKRKENQFSQSELAQKLGYKGHQFVSSWEQGTAFPPMTELFKLADLLNASVNMLYEAMLADTLEKTRQIMQDDFDKHKNQTKRKCG